MKDETRKAENKTRIRDCLKKRAFWKGSYTVEAALVFPIILFVLAALLILAFYVHDRGILQGLAKEDQIHQHLPFCMHRRPHHFTSIPAPMRGSR